MVRPSGVRLSTKFLSDTACTTVTSRMYDAHMGLFGDGDEDGGFTGPKGAPGEGGGITDEYQQYLIANNRHVNPDGTEGFGRDDSPTGLRRDGSSDAGGRPQPQGANPGGMRGVPDEDDEDAEEDERGPEGDKMPGADDLPNYTIWGRMLRHFGR